MKERAWLLQEIIFTEKLNSLLEHNHCHGKPLSCKKLQKAVSRVMEEEEKYFECNVNKVTTDTLFQFPITINAQNKDINVTYERQMASGILAETINNSRDARSNQLSVILHTPIPRNRLTP